jgi:hypothetical protein
MITAAPEKFDQNGELTDDYTRKALAKLLEEFSAFIQKLKQ